MKIFKNFKENRNLAKNLSDLNEMQEKAMMTIKRYERLIEKTEDAESRLKSLCHFRYERIKELEQKLKIYEELILKGNLK